ncbi:MAG: DUF72 domain-containing protein, partial [Balneolaceae bacterium]
MGVKNIHIGCTQWGFKEWIGKFYREGTPAKRFLAEYATVFNTVEGNTTFYRVPSADTVQNWGAQVPDEFKFCFKFPQSITHYKRLKDTDSDVLSFIERFDGIAPKLGPFHIQLHAGFSFSEFEVPLKRVVDEALVNCPSVERVIVFDCLGWAPQM